MKKTEAKEIKIKDYNQLKEPADQIIQPLFQEGLIIYSLEEGEIQKDYKNLINLFLRKNSNEALELFGYIKNQFKNYLEEIEKDKLQELTDLFMETEWLIHDLPQRNPEYYTAQIMANAELVFSYSMYLLLNNKNINAEWFDARDIIKATEEFPVGKLIANPDFSAIENLKASQSEKIIITQGRIASTMDNENTLLIENPWKTILN